MRNLTEKTSEQYLVHLFNQWCSGQVERVKKAKDYAFVHFYNRAAAEMAKMYSGIYVHMQRPDSAAWNHGILIALCIKFGGRM